MVLHLYSGEKDGYTLSRALKEVGGDPRKLKEIDVLHGGEENDLGVEGAGYAKCLHLALEGQIKGVLGGPPCRTRSMLRHIEVEGVPDLPRPVRAWGGEEFGLADLKPKEKDQVEEDDILMFRSWMIWILAEETRKAEGKTEPVSFGLEQPAIPANDGVVTIWKTPQWRNFAEAYDFHRQAFNQGDFGGLAKKPTAWGGNLPILLPETRGGGKRRDVAGKTKEEIIAESKKLARWAPGMMRSVAASLQQITFRGKVVIKKLSWQEHLNANHVPFRRDCRVCQEACARDHHHRRSKLPPRAGVLSIDMAGPFVAAPDLFRGKKARYFLASTFTWPDPKQDDLPEETFEDPGCPDDAPWIEVEEDVFDPTRKKRGRPSKKDIQARKEAEEKERKGGEIENAPLPKISEEKGGEIEDAPLPKDSEGKGGEIEDAPLPKDSEGKGGEIEDAPLPQRIEEGGEEVEEQFKFTPGPDFEVDSYEPSIAPEEEEEAEVRKDPKIKFFRFITPLGSRVKGEVLKAIVDIYLRLRSAGMEVRQIHSDNAGEFASTMLSQWCTQRAILQTYTPGDQPQSNGRAEQTVAELKSRIRRMLLAANVGSEKWPLAARCLSEMLWIEALGETKKCPPFMSEVLVRKRHWKAEEFMPTQEKSHIRGNWLSI